MSRPATGRRIDMRRSQLYDAAPTWTPADDPDTALWLRSDYGVALSGADVQTWTDLTTGVVCTPLGAGAKPIYDPISLDGERPGISIQTLGFSCPIGARMSGATGYTVFLVYRDTATAQNTHYLCEYGTNGAANAGEFCVLLNFFSVNNNLAMFSPGSAGVNQWRANANTAPMATACIVTLQTDFTLATDEISPIRLNDDALAGAYTTNTNSAGTTLINGVFHLGSRSAANGTPVTFGECIVVKRALSPADRALFQTYLATRYGLPTVAQLAARPTPVIILAGQSNAQDQTAAVTSTTSSWNGPHAAPYVPAWRHSVIGGSDVTETWQAANGRQFGVINALGWPGADLSSLLTQVRRCGLAPRLIEYTHSATTLAVDWLPPAGADYVALAADIATAIAADPSPPASPIYIMDWDQGESDSAVTAYADDYYANLVTFMAAVRALPGLGDMRVMISGLNPSCALGTPTTCATIRAAQQLFCANNPTWSTYIETYPSITYYDNVHRTNAGKVLIGQYKASAAAYLARLP